MQTPDRPRFFQALSLMGEFFADDLSEVRQRLYWELTSELCAIEEWDYACKRAMQEATFHKVPLIAALMVYVQEYRDREWEDQKRAERHRLLDEAMRGTGPPQIPATQEEIHGHVSALLAKLDSNMDMRTARRVEQTADYSTPLDEGRARRSQSPAQSASGPARCRGGVSCISTPVEAPRPRNRWRSRHVWPVATPTRMPGTSIIWCSRERCPPPMLRPISTAIS